MIRFLYKKKNNHVMSVDFFWRVEMKLFFFVASKKKKNLKTEAVLFSSQCFPIPALL